jgi:hypothetical protein
MKPHIYIKFQVLKYHSGSETVVSVHDAYEEAEKWIDDNMPVAKGDVYRMPVYQIRKVYVNRSAGDQVIILQEVEGELS